MSKLLTILMASAAALVINGVATAAEQDQPSASPSAQNTEEQQPSPTKGKPDQHEADTGMPEATEGSPDPSAENQADQGQADSQAQGADKESTDSQARSNEQSGHTEEYAEAIKKCQSMTGTEQQDCMDKAKKDHGQM